MIAFEMLYILRVLCDIIHSQEQFDFLAPVHQPFVGYVLDDHMCKEGLPLSFQHQVLEAGDEKHK